MRGIKELYLEKLPMYRLQHKKAKMSKGLPVVRERMMTEVVRSTADQVEVEH